MREEIRVSLAELLQIAISDCNVLPHNSNLVFMTFCVFAPLREIFRDLPTAIVLTAQREVVIFVKNELEW